MAPCLFAKGSSGVPKMISLPLRLPGETQLVVLSAASQRRSPCCPRVRDRVGQGSEADSLFASDFASLRAMVSGDLCVHDGRLAHYLSQMTVWEGAVSDGLVRLKNGTTMRTQRWSSRCEDGRR